jgi:hypothetical protein
MKYITYIVIIAGISVRDVTIDRLPWMLGFTLALPTYLLLIFICEKAFKHK